MESFCSPPPKPLPNDTRFPPLFPPPLRRIFGAFFSPPLLVFTRREFPSFFLPEKMAFAFPSPVLNSFYVFFCPPLGVRKFFFFSNSAFFAFFSIAVLVVFPFLLCPDTYMFCLKLRIPPVDDVCIGNKSVIDEVKNMTRSSTGRATELGFSILRKFI